MKNITLAIDSELHRKAKVFAAQHDMSLSKLVAFCIQEMLNETAKAESVSGEEAEEAAEVAAEPNSVKEEPMPFKHSKSGPDWPDKPSGSGVETGPDGEPYYVDGKWVWTPGGKSRTPGALKGKIVMADDFTDTPDWLIDAFEGLDADKPWPDA